ncbi:alpha/beta fold hydrolase [Rhodococcus sp. ACPA1]|uniref:alpha/beta fold hydrolase n=1 Tax=Rhodococcus sp. ACPA1 TaxID=2028572 RepID=UPI000BB1021D|nr:alpha/beta hydrolase [Rhodococcus sp. ACPA1]PBC51539.1 hypothetical protein CJ177_34160 [Rhodococcus sp. ACPA1]
MVASLTPLGLHISHQGPQNAAVQMILVHGAMDSSESMARLAAELSAHATVRYDRRGYGQSSLPAGACPPSLTDHIVDLQSLVGDIPTVLVGHSLGATISLAVAQRLPGRVLGVMAYEPPLPWEPWWPAPPIPDIGAGTNEIRQAAEDFMRRAMGGQRWEGLDSDVRSTFLSWGAVWAAELREAQNRHAFTAGELRVPVVVAYGSETDDRHRQGAVELAGRVHDSQLVTVEGGTHAAHRRKPRELAKLAHDLMNRITER